MSNLVWAEKFFLQVRVAGGDGGYDKKGSKVSDGSKLVPRDFVASRNAIDNNELYVIDEEETTRLMALRTENVAKQVAERKIKTASPTDVLSQIASGMKVLSENQTGDVDKNVEIAELKAECDELGIEYSGRAGVNKLTELINEFKQNSEGNGE